MHILVLSFLLLARHIQSEDVPAPALLQHFESLSLVREEPECSASLFAVTVCSLVFSSLAFCVSVRAGTMIAVIVDILLLVISILEGSMTALLRSEKVHQTCYLFIICELVSLVLWTFLFFAEKFELHFHLVACLSPTVTKIFRDRFQAIKSHICGPAQEFYGSAQFQDMCEKAIREAINNQDDILDVHSFHLAVCNVVHDADWITSRWLKALMHAHRSTPIPADERLELLQQTAAVVMETRGCGLPVLYDLRILQVCATPSQVNVEQIDTAFEHLALQWHPKNRKDVASQQAIVDFARIHTSYENAIAHVKAQCKPTKKL